MSEICARGGSRASSSLERTAFSTGGGSAWISRVPSDSGDRRDLAYSDVEPVLARLASLPEQVILVGGQALNFWAEYYVDRLPALQAQAPFTSKDIDFVGSAAAARACARALGGEARLATMDDVTPNLGVVRFVDGQGTVRVIDFLDQPYGVTADEVHRTALSVEPLDEALKGSGARVNVMHPVLCMESRVSNVLGLREYQNERGIRQARVSVLCAKEFLRDLLDAGETRAVLNLNERIFRFATTGARKDVVARFNIEPFEAVLVDERLPPEFERTRYPQMRRVLHQVREQRSRDLDRGR